MVIVLQASVVCNPPTKISIWNHFCSQNSVVISFDFCSYLVFFIYLLYYWMFCALVISNISNFFLVRAFPYFLSSTVIQNLFHRSFLFLILPEQKRAVRKIWNLWYRFFRGHWLQRQGQLTSITSGSKSFESQMKKKWHKKFWNNSHICFWGRQFEFGVSIRV